MQPRPITDRDVHHWSGYGDVQVAVFTTPEEIEAGVTPCEGIITPPQDDGFGNAVRVPWVLSEIELMHLAQGGTLWLSTWGGLPMHSLEVQEPDTPVPPSPE